MKLKPLTFTDNNGHLVCHVLGMSCSIYPNNGKWDACVYMPPYNRPEICTGLLSELDAKVWVERLVYSMILSALDL